MPPLEGYRPHMLRFPGLLLLVASLIGCTTPLFLDRAVLAYDDLATNMLSKQLLLNIARARHHLPIHFTSLANIAATFDFRFQAGLSPALTGEASTALLPLLGASVAENPTVSIVPIEGEEFTKRLLTPIEESKLTLLLRQGVDVDLLLRLAVAELRMKDDAHGEEKAYFNRPADAVGYPVFRRAMTHLSAIQDRNQLYIEPLMYKRRLPFHGAPTPEAMAADKLNHAHIEYDAASHSYFIEQQVPGRLAITNYDPNTIAVSDLQRLHEEAEHQAANEIMLDIRVGHVGGEMPLHGKLRLRSFYNILNFIGRSMSDELEYDVEADPRTPRIAENPVYALAVSEAESDNTLEEPNVKFRGQYYGLTEEAHYPWNREGFRLLHQLFQLTVTDLPRGVGPPITIAK